MRRERNPSPVVFVTGAAHGIGAATAKLLHLRGARLVLFDKDRAALSSLATSLGERVLTFAGDVSRSEDLASAVALATETFGGIDVAWANAGIATFGTLEQADPQAWWRCVEVNIRGTYETVRHCLPSVISRRGVVAVTASAASFARLPGMSAYSASKAALEAMADALRLEVGDLGVRVLSIHPAWVNTSLLEAFSSSRGFQVLRKSMPGPLGRSVDVQPTAHSIAATLLAGRCRRLFLPPWVAVMFAARSLIHAGLFEGPLRTAGRRVRTAFESDVDRLGAANASNGDRPPSG